VYSWRVRFPSILEARKYAASELQRPQGYNFPSGTPECPTNTGRVNYIEGGFLSAQWEHHALNRGINFDLIYDYTFLCALHPNLRPQWADRMALLPRQDGLLICLEYPMYKDPSWPGLPWGT
ncbi:uncharacterized protein BO80DRAFT_471066, partial [Aspergillus ibericus CBS 121593]